MFKNMKLGAKIAAGFAAILILSTVLGGFCTISMKNAQIQSGKLSNEYVPVVNAANNVERNILLAMVEVRGYAMSEKDSYFEKGKAYLDKSNQHFKELDALIEKYPSLKNMKEGSDTLETSLLEYEKIVEETKAVIDNRLATYKEVVSLGNEILADLETINKTGSLLVKESTNKALILMLKVRMAALRSKALNDPKYFAEAINNFDEIYQDISGIRAATKNAATLQLTDKIKADCEKYKAAMARYQEQMVSLIASEKKRAPLVLAVQNEVKEMAESCMKKAQSTASTSAISLSVTSTLMILGLIAAIAIGTILAWLIVVGITKPINKIIDGLHESSDQVTSASGQLSSSSQQLAEGSAEQAASIQETSATLEESASMIRQNTENTRQAALLAKQARDSADKGNKEMQDMMTSMEELKKSSDQIAKIIKVIDEIAFQTNILALNAAVEAARAGEAGMGFAVVAEEVRNLAQRSAQAAKDTASIIESNIELSEKGVDVSTKVNQSLAEIYEESHKVNELLDEIAAASQEQTQGIAQINKAISQMEQVVQSNAATAEESAAGSEELSSQAMNMKDIVNSLMQLVNGAQLELNQSNYRDSIYKALPDRNKIAQNNFSGRANKRANSAKSNLINSYDKNTQVVNPEQVIPLEDDTQGF